MTILETSKNVECTDSQIYLSGHDMSFIAALTESLEQADYRVKHFTSLLDLEKACKKSSPQAILLDVELNDGESEVLNFISELKKSLEACPPLILISEHGDIKTRLAAVRLGLNHYFCKPLDSEKLINTIDDLVRPITENPYRILIVDDDEPLLKCYAEMLSEAGMIVETTSNPFECINLLNKKPPDVLVMDVYMPKCTGPELVQVIRQDDAWEFIPIVYLSTEADLNSQLKAMQLGADDYLTKPVQSFHLVSVLTAMAKRARKSIQLHKELEYSLRESEFQLATMNQHDIVSIADVAGRITHVNDKFCEISGYSRNELLGKNHRLLKSEAHSNSFYEEMWAEISQGKIWRGIICNRKKDGDEYWVDSTIVPFLDDKGKPYKYVSARTDITALRQSEERLSRSHEFSNIGTWDWNITTGELFWSDRIWTLFGYEKEITETTYDNFLFAIHLDDRQKVIEAVNNCVSQGGDYNIEHRVVWPDGSIHWVHEKGDVVRDKDGKAQRMLGVVQNINVRKHAELEMKESEAQLRQAQTLSCIGNWQVDVVSGELRWSEEMYRIFGRDPKNFSPSIKTFHAAVHPDDLPGVIKTEEQAGKTDKRDFVFRIVRPDGEVRHVHETARRDIDSEGNLNLLSMSGTIQDITEREKMQEQLRKQKKLLDVLHSSTTDFVEKGDIRETMAVMLNELLEITESEYGFAGEVIVDSAGNPYIKTHAITDISWDKKSQKLFQSSVDAGFELREQETLYGRVLTSGEHLISNDPGADSRAGGLPLGHPPMNSFLGVPIYYGSELVGMYGISNRERGYEESIREFLRPFDTTYGLMIHSKRMLDADHNNRIELMLAKEEAETANLAKSKFLSSMSHELRTPLNAIMGFGQLLKLEKDPPLSLSQEENIDEITLAGNHLLKLINEILDLSKIESGHIDILLETVALGEVLNEALQLITPLAEKNGISINAILNGSEVLLEDLCLQQCSVQADRTRFIQALLNILSNAIKYNRKDGTIIIDCQNIDRKDESPFMRISISDTGLGLTPDQQTQLFQSFNRLGAEQSDIEGTGIGLVITKSIIELMGGNIGVRSQPGKGSTFWLELPTGSTLKERKSAPEKQESAQLNDVSFEGQKHTVLYIEDNPANLRLVAQLFARLGNLHMWSAHEPFLGLKMAEEHKPDLILLDINLPGMDGFEVLKSLRERKVTRDIPVIAISANAMPKDIERGVEAGFDDYITKPINVKKLLRSVDLRLTDDLQD